MVKDVVRSERELREIYDQPSARAVCKETPTLGDDCRAFIAHSPFLVMGTAGADGTCDVSPKGDAPGFVRVLDDRRLRIPDARGNRRLDSFSNVLENPRAGLLFLIPGMGETLRVNGRCEIARDADPQVSLIVTVEEAYLHCAKALIRSRLWDPPAWPAAAELPSAARIFSDHTGLGDESAAAEMLRESYTKRL
jgi:PPOX class probable FMN-dependent enzyme